MVYKVFLLIFAAIFLTACKSTEIPAPLLVSPLPESKAANLDLEGSVWIFESEKTTRFPGYRGIYMGKDGKLLLINFPDAIGKRWEIQGNLLSLSFLEGAPELMGLSLTQNLHIIVESVENDLPRHIRLIPENNREIMGISLVRGASEIDLVENYWLLKSLTGSDDIDWPIETDIHMILLPNRDGIGILGHGGVNRFTGKVELKEETFKVDHLASTLMNGPHLEFENLYFLGLKSINRYFQVDFDLFLYSDTRPVAGFRALLFN